MSRPSQAQDREIQVVHLRHALSLARLSPPKPTNFRVGAVLVSNAQNHNVLSTGYTLELPGNTHAEQCALTKLAASQTSGNHAEQTSTSDSIEPKFPDEGATIYTTMEPCIFRLSGNAPCVQRILDTRKNGQTGITTVVCGATEPETFVGENKGRKTLEDAGIEVIYVLDLQEEILEVATAGHVKDIKP
jgi:pyrimidine deaminase RibD-like protein